MREFLLILASNLATKISLEKVKLPFHPLTGLQIDDLSDLIGQSRDSNLIG